MQLLPTLIETAKSSPPGTVRVVNIASDAAMLYPKAHVDFTAVTMKDLDARKKMGPMGLYQQSKFGNVLFANEFARRYADAGIVSTSLHPGKSQRLCTCSRSSDGTTLRCPGIIRTELLGNSSIPKVVQFILVRFILF